MYEFTILREFLGLLAQPRHAAKQMVPDGSGIWFCIAYGLERLVENLAVSEEIRLSSELLASLKNLDARVGQFARASRSWTAEAEWDSVEDYARQALALLDRDVSPSSGSP
jgi:hypothetical protein